MPNYVWINSAITVGVNPKICGKSHKSFMHFFLIPYPFRIETITVLHNFFFTFCELPCIFRKISGVDFRLEFRKFPFLENPQYLTIKPLELKKRIHTFPEGIFEKVNSRA